jgi:hypothetical protein
VKTRRRCSACAMLLAIAALSACGSDGGGAASSGSSPQPTTARSTTTTAPDLAHDSAAAKSAYLAYWAMFDRVTNPPSPSDPGISQLTVDPARADLIDGVKTLQAAGQSVREGTPAATHAVDVVIAGTQANFTDCFVDSRVIVDSVGSVVNDKVVTKLLKGHLTIDEGAWKVAQYDEVQRRDGSASCES